MELTKRTSVLRAWLVAAGLLFVGCAHKSPPQQTLAPRRMYMETMLTADPGAEPRLAFVLLGHYNATGQQRAGLEFFESVLRSHAVDPVLRGLYTGLIGTLRAQSAAEIPLARRLGWAKQAIRELDESVKLTEGMFIARWLRAVVFAQLPPMFDQEQKALEELKWLEANIDQAPAPGLLREVLYLQAEIHRKRGQVERAQALLARSGYPAFDRPKALNTPFTLDPEIGFAFARPQIIEHVPGRVFQASGYDFMDYYFVVSSDETATIAIDMGSRADAAKRATEALRTQHPQLPPITTVLVTHVHWDHIGGQRYFRGLASKPEMYSNANWRSQLDRQEGSGGPYESWWGSRFDLSAVTEYRPDAEIAERTQITVGGTEIDLIPIPGGETRDAMLMHFPSLGVTFAGDMIMPYIGAPHIEEGNPRGLLESLDIVATLQTKLVLHGHQGINGLFPTPQELVAIRGPLAWLLDETERLTAEGASRADIHHQNLIAPALRDGDDPSALAYLVLRPHFVNRIIDRRRGYWEEPFAGADTVTREEFGTILTHYAGLRPRKQVALVEDMIEAGDHELALHAIQWLLPHADRRRKRELTELKRQTILALMDRYQNTDAFKFIWYGGSIDARVGPALPRRAVRQGSLTRFSCPMGHRGRSGSKPPNHRAQGRGTAAAKSSRMSASVSALAVSAALLSSTPTPATVPAESQPDPAVAAERAAIVAKGKRFNYVSAGFTVASLSLTLTSIFIARPGNEVQVVAMAGTAAGLAGVGLGFAIAGMRRVQASGEVHENGRRRASVRTELRRRERPGSLLAPS